MKMTRKLTAFLAASLLALVGISDPAAAALQFSTPARTAEAAAFQATYGSTAGNLVIYSGATPASCGATEAGTVLATIPLPTAIFTSASGVATQAGTWSANATAAGTATHFEIQTSAPACLVLGNTTTDLVLQNTNIAVGQTITVTSFTITEGNQ